MYHTKKVYIPDCNIVYWIKEKRLNLIVAWQKRAFYLAGFNRDESFHPQISISDQSDAFPNTKVIIIVIKNLRRTWIWDVGIVFLTKFEKQFTILQLKFSRAAVSEEREGLGGGLLVGWGVGGVAEGERDEPRQPALASPGGERRRATYSHKYLIPSLIYLFMQHLRSIWYTWVFHVTEVMF